MKNGGARPGAGRKPGSVAAHTLKAQLAKQKLIEAYIKNIKPINEALIKKAREGDMAAIKELHDRVYGKSVQPISGDPENPVVFQITGMKIVKE